MTHSVTDNLERRLSPSLFALVCLAFVLPFATVSCDGAETSFTGVQLVTHTVPAGGPVADGRDLAEPIEAECWFAATLALAAAVAGILLGLGGRPGEGWCTAIGSAGMLFLLARAFAPLGPVVTFRAGFVIALALYLVLVLQHARRALRRRKEALG